MLYTEVQIDGIEIYDEFFVKTGFKILTSNFMRYNGVKLGKYIRAVVSPAHHGAGAVSLRRKVGTTGDPGRPDG